MALRSSTMAERGTIMLSQLNFSVRAGIEGVAVVGIFMGITLLVPVEASAQSDCTEECVEISSDDGSQTGWACVDRGNTTLQDDCYVGASDYCSAQFCEVTLAQNDSGVVLGAVGESNCSGLEWAEMRSENSHRVAGRDFILGEG